MAFVLSGLIFLMTVLGSVVVFWANAMSDAPSQSHPEQGLYVFLAGCALAGVVLWSHWWHVGW